MEFLGRSARRAVTERCATARHVKRPNNAFYRRDLRGSVQTARSFGSLAPPITNQLSPITFPLQISSPGLLSFQRFEQRLKIARSETFAAVAADDFVK